MAIRVGIIHDNIETLNRFKATIEAYQPFLQVDFACSSMKEVERNEVTSMHYSTDILLLDMDMHNDSMAGFKVIDMYKQKRHKPKIMKRLRVNTRNRRPLSGNPCRPAGAGPRSPCPYSR